MPCCASSGLFPLVCNPFPQRLLGATETDRVGPLRVGPFFCVFITSPNTHDNSPSNGNTASTSQNPRQRFHRLDPEKFAAMPDNVTGR